MGASGFEAGDLGRALMRAFFGELGDKTFFLTAVLATWCPWEGVRNGDHLSTQQVLVCAGAILGLFAHVVVVASIRSSAWDTWRHQSWVFELTSCTLLALLGLRAYVGRVGAVLPSTADAEGAESDPLVRKEPEPQYNKDAFTFPALPTTEHDYGSTGDMMMTADGLLGERISNHACSTIFAFVATASLIFVLEAEDKSWYALVAGDRQGSDTVLGAAMGFMSMAMVAALVGHVLWFQLEAYHVRFLAISTLLSLSLVSFSQAMLHIRCLDGHDQETRTTA